MPASIENPSDPLNPTNRTRNYTNKTAPFSCIFVDRYCFFINLLEAGIARRSKLIARRSLKSHLEPAGIARRFNSCWLIQ
jgi:hypothetical protein